MSRTIMRGIVLSVVTLHLLLGGAGGAAGASPLLGTPVAMSRPKPEGLASSSESKGSSAALSLELWMVEMLEAVNGARRDNNVAALCYNQKIIDAAVRHNNDMAANDFFSHTGSDGSEVWERVEARGYDWSSVAENIAKGYVSVNEVMNGWLNSPGHRTNILSASNAHFGAAWDPGDNYWTQVFASSFDAGEGCVDAAPPAPPPAPPPVPPPAPPPTPPPTAKAKKSSRSSKSKKAGAGRTQSNPFT